MITPWGRSQTMDQVAPGIKFISTASHGGYKVNKEQNLRIPELFRDSQGWYEEDCQWASVVYFLGDTFTQPIQHLSNPDLMYVHAVETLQNWFPHEWQEYNGIARQSSTKCWDCNKENCKL